MDSSRVCTPRAFCAFSVFRDARVLPIRKSTARAHHCGLASRGSVFLSSWGRCRFRSLEVMSKSSHLMASSAESAPKLFFKLPCQVPFGVVLRLVGSAPELGEWLIDNGTDFEWTEGHIWKLTLESPPTAQCSYKVVAINTFDGSVEWETCNDRVLEPCLSDTDIELAWNEWEPVKRVPSGEGAEEAQTELIESEKQQSTEAAKEESVGKAGSDSKDEGRPGDSANGSWNVESAVDEEAGVGDDDEFGQGAHAGDASADNTASLDECSSVVEAVELKAEVSKIQQDESETEGKSEKGDGAVAGSSGETAPKDVNATTTDVNKDSFSSSPSSSEGSSRVGAGTEPPVSEKVSEKVETEDPPGPRVYSDSNEFDQLDEEQAAVVLGKEPPPLKPKKKIVQGTGDSVVPKKEVVQGTGDSVIPKKEVVQGTGDSVVSKKLEDQPETVAAGNKPSVSKAEQKEGTDLKKSDDKGESSPVVAEKATDRSEPDKSIPKPDKSIPKPDKSIPKPNGDAPEGSKEKTPGNEFAPEKNGQGQSAFSVTATGKVSTQAKAEQIRKETTATVGKESSPSRATNQSQKKGAPKKASTPSAAEQGDKGSDVGGAPKAGDRKEATAVPEKVPIPSKLEQSVVQPNAVDVPRELKQKKAAVVANKQPVAVSKPQKSGKEPNTNKGFKGFGQKKAPVVAKNDSAPSLKREPVAKPALVGSDTDTNKGFKGVGQKKASVVAEGEATPLSRKAAAKQPHVQETPGKPVRKEPVVAAAVDKSSPSKLSKPEQTISKPDVAGDSKESNEKKASVSVKGELKPQRSSAPSKPKSTSKTVDRKQVASVAQQEPIPSQRAGQATANDAPQRLDQKQPSVVPKSKPAPGKAGAVSNATDIHTKKPAAAVAEGIPTLSKPKRSTGLPDANGEVPSSVADTKPAPPVSKDATVVSKGTAARSSVVAPARKESTSSKAGARADSPMKKSEEIPTAQKPVASTVGEATAPNSRGFGSVTGGVAMNGTGKTGAPKEEPQGAEIVVSEDDGSVLFTSDYLARDVPPELAAAFDSLLPEAYRRGAKGEEKSFVASMGGPQSKWPHALWQLNHPITASRMEVNGTDQKKAASTAGKNTLGPGLTAAALGVGTAVLGSFGLEMTDAIVGGALLFVGSAAVFSKSESERKRPKQLKPDWGRVIDVNEEDEKKKKEEKRKKKEKEDKEMKAKLSRSSAPGVALAALFMVPLMAGSKVLNTMDKVKAEPDKAKDKSDEASDNAKDKGNNESEGQENES